MIPVGLIHVAVLVVAIAIGSFQKAEGQSSPSQDRTPILDPIPDEPKPQADKPKIAPNTSPSPKFQAKSAAGGITEVKLESLTPVASKTGTIDILAGQFKAFSSDDKSSWTIDTASDDAAENGIVLEELAAGAIIVGYDVANQKWGKYRVPGQSAVVLACCNPSAKGKYVISRLETVDGKPKVVEKSYILVKGGGSDGGKKEEKKEEKADGGEGKKEEKKETKPQPPKQVKIKAVIVEETAELSAKRSKFFDSQAIKDRWKAKGHLPWTVIDKDTKDPVTKQTPTAVKAYVDRARDKTLPQLYLVDSETGKVLYEGPAYDDEAAFLNILDKIGG